MDLLDDFDEFVKQDNKSIKCMFIGVGEFQSKAQKTQNVRKDRTIAQITKFLIKNLSLNSSDTLNIFVSDSFLPNLDEKLFDLHQKFRNNDDVLVLKYSKQETYG